MVAAFVVCGIQGLKTARSRRTFGDGRLNSADRFLLEALHVDQGGERIVNAISDLPPLQPLAVLAPADNVYGPLLLQAIGAITWPHQICFIQAGDATLAKTLGVLHEHHFAAALLYDLAPPAPDPNDRHVGLLTIVPVAK
jgi:hypothetical protein